jgi:hypothetical protein
VNEGGGTFLPDRDVWHASAALNLAAVRWLGVERWLPELWIYAAGNNLSDEAVRDARAFPQPGRSWTGGVEARW